MPKPLRYLLGTVRKRGTAPWFGSSVLACRSFSARIVLSTAPGKPETSTKPATGAGAAPAAGNAAKPVIKPRIDMAAVWPIPALLLSGGLLAGGLAYGLSKTPKADPSTPLVEIRELVSRSEFEAAIAMLNSKLIPVIQAGKLSAEQTGEFYLLRARALFDGQSALGVSLADNHRAILSDYASAKEALPKESIGKEDALTVTQDDHARIAQSQLALGQIDAALKTAKFLSAEQWPLRARILRAVAAGNLSGRAGREKYEQTLAVLAELENSIKSTADDRSWAMIRQGELRLSMRYYEEAISRLLRAIPMLEGAGPQTRAELLRLLGRAYFQAGRPEQAMEQLEASVAASQASGGDEEGAAEAELLIGQLLQFQGKHEDAVGRLAPLVSMPATDRTMMMHLQARAALAESLAATGDDLEAARQYEAVLDAMRVASAKPSASVVANFSLAEVGRSILLRAADRSSREQYQVALMYAELARRAFAAAHQYKQAAQTPERAGGHPAPAAPEGHAPSQPAAMPASASHGGEHGAEHPGGADASERGGTRAGGPSQVHSQDHASTLGQSPGEDAMGTKAAPSDDGLDGSGLTAGSLAAKDAEGIPAAVYLIAARAHRLIAENTLSEARQSEVGLLRIDQISPATAAEAKRHFLDAGSAFRQHASLMVTADGGAAADSQWQSAECYDLAGDREAARDSFAAYSTNASDNDPRKGEARFRLAQVLQSQGELAAAAAQYKAVIEARDAGESGGAGSGLIADRSLVPLARCMLGDKLPENDGEAEAILRTLLGGTTFSPDAVEYREALVELGEQLHRTGRFTESAGLLEEAKQRFPAADEAVRIIFKLADCYRQSAAAISDELRAALPQDRRDELLRLRQTRLTRAGELFMGVVRTVGTRDMRRITQLDRVMERNATFYQADAAFELGDDETAIRLYDAAAQRYAADPASLLARVQIVSCYLRSGKLADAAAANSRAKRQLASIPLGAFEQPDMPMSRAHWERWLAADTSLQNGLSGSQGGGQPGNQPPAPGLTGAGNSRAGSPDGRE